MSDEKDRINEGRSERQEEIDKTDLDTSKSYTDNTGCLTRAREETKERQKKIDKMSVEN